jgi:5-methylcytosine-specific restriction protein A
MRRPPRLAVQSAPRAPRAPKPAFLRWYGLQVWRKRAARQLAEDPLCAMCKSRGRITAAKVADHFPHHGGNREQFLHGPLRSLCWSCHSSHSLEDRAARRTGRLPRIKGADARGIPLDPTHHWHEEGVE